MNITAIRPGELAPDGGLTEFGMEQADSMINRFRPGEFDTVFSALDEASFYMGGRLAQRQDSHLVFRTDALDFRDYEDEQYEPGELSRMERNLRNGKVKSEEYDPFDTTYQNAFRQVGGFICSLSIQQHRKNIAIIAPSPTIQIIRRIARDDISGDPSSVSAKIPYRFNFGPEKILSISSAIDRMADEELGARIWTPENDTPEEVSA